MPFKASARGAYGPQGQKVVKGPLAPVWVTFSPPAATSAAYSYTFVATDDSGDAPTYSLGSGSLPNGLTLNATTGVLSGTCTVASTFTFTIRATDVNGRFTDTSSLSITVTLRVAADYSLSAANALGSFIVGDRITSGFGNGSSYTTSTTLKNATAVRLSCAGGGGGANAGGNNNGGGNGGVIVGDFNVSNLSSSFITYIGGGGNANSGNNGSGGGGYSAFRRGSDSNWLIVAGAGGGSGGTEGCTAGRGGDGGYPSGNNGQSASGQGGGGGSASGGGYGGSGSYGGGNAGSAFQGGQAGSCGGCNGGGGTNGGGGGGYGHGGGGGGGAGFYGGGGGGAQSACSGGGGGGSSWVSGFGTLYSSTTGGISNRGASNNSGGSGELIITITAI